MACWLSAYELVHDLRTQADSKQNEDDVGASTPDNNAMDSPSETGGRSSLASLAPALGRFPLEKAEPHAATDEDGQIPIYVASSSGGSRAEAIESMQDAAELPSSRRVEYPSEEDEKPYPRRGKTKMSRQYFFQDGMTLPTTLSDYNTTTPLDKAEHNAVEEIDGATLHRRADSDEHILDPRTSLQIPEKSRFAHAFDLDLQFLDTATAPAEAEEACWEEEYQEKKAPEREVQRKKQEAETAAYEANMEETYRRTEELEAARQRQRLEDLSDEANTKIFAAPMAPINDKDGRTDLEYDDDAESMMKGATNRPGSVGVHANNPEQSNEETPRSRRRKMLETELTESLRNDILWARQSSEQAKANAEGARDSTSVQERGRSDDGRTTLSVG